jgi:hypothetical protein
MNPIGSRPKGGEALVSGYINIDYFGAQPVSFFLLCLLESIVYQAANAFGIQLPSLEHFSDQNRRRRFQ